MNQEQRIEYFMSEIARLSNQVVDLQNERDALAAQVEALRKALAALSVQAESALQEDIVCHSALKRAQREADEVLDTTPQQHLAEIRAQAGELGYYNGFKDALVIGPPLPPATGTYATVDIFAYRVEQSSRYAANQYAEQIRQEVK